MLDSLHIKNFRNLEELKIESLGQVNLITGKNNTGKSSLLEAVAVYANKGDLNLIYRLLDYRGEDFTDVIRFRDESKDDNIGKDSVFHSLTSMFTDRKIAMDNPIHIGPFNTDGTLKDVLCLRFVKYIEEIEKDAQGNTIHRRKIVSDKDDINISEYGIGFEMQFNDVSTLVSLNRRAFRFMGEPFNQMERTQFVRTLVVEQETNSKLFDNIALTEKEQYVIDSLRIIEPATERIAFIEKKPRGRTPVIKLTGVPEVLPIKRMGDGINRILTIILALVNAENGYLLLDEFENGLHYSVQEKLWEIIFKLSQRLNVQVFATTHSNDCISGFEQVLNNETNQMNGKLIRLNNVNGVIKQVEYTPREMKIANEHNVEMR